MDEKQLIDRLIQDLESSINIRTSVPDVHTQIKSIGSKDNDLSNFVGALNTIGFDVTLKNVIEIINWGNDGLISTDFENSLVVLNSILQNKDKVIAQIGKVLNDSNLVAYGGNDMQPLGELLIDKLDDLHSQSGKYLPR